MLSLRIFPLWGNAVWFGKLRPKERKSREAGTLIQILMTALNAVLPIVLLIAVGYWLRQKGKISDGFLKNGNWLVFHVCLPCMLLANIYSIESLSAIRWDITLYSAVGLCVIFLVGLVAAVATTPIPQRRGVILQCSFRGNFAIIGMPLAGALGGAGAEAAAAVMSSVAVPMINVLAVVALSLFVEQDGAGKRSVKHILLDIVKNPPIIGTALGMLCLVLRWAQEAVFGETVFALNRELKSLYIVLTYLKSITTPLALIVLGGQFAFSAVKELRKEIIVATLLRVVVAPALGIGGAYLLSRFTGILYCGTDEYAALIALFGSPVAVSSAVMAVEMKNDGQLATQLVVWTSVCSGVTIFLLSCLLMGLGLIAL